MNIVVLGGGKVGFTLVKQLAEENHDITLIDTNRRVSENASNSLDIKGIFGNGVNHQTQLEAEVPRSDLFIATAGSDELNMLCCLIAKHLGAKHTIARIRNPEYLDQLSFMRDELGLSMYINPDYSAAEEMFRLLRIPSALNVSTFPGSNVEIIELKVAEGSQLDGIMLKNFTKKYRTKALICAVRRGDEVYIPDGNFTINASDRISITAAPAEIEAFLALAGYPNQGVRRVMLVGGSRICYYLAEMLLHLGVEVTIIEQDEKRCIELSELLPKAMVICGDGSDQDVLLEEGIKEADAFASLTGVDEENIIIALYAQSIMTGKVIAKVNSSPLSAIALGIGLDSTITPKEITANQIISYVRGIQNPRGSGVESLRRIAGGRVEALEFTAKGSAAPIGILFKDLPTPPNLLISNIRRGKEDIVPGGNDMIMDGDKVIVITTKEHINDLSDIIKK